MQNLYFYQFAVAFGEKLNFFIKNLRILQFLQIYDKKGFVVIFHNLRKLVRQSLQ